MSKPIQIVPAIAIVHHDRPARTPPLVAAPRPGWGGARRPRPRDTRSRRTPFATDSQIGPWDSRNASGAVGEIPSRASGGGGLRIHPEAARRTRQAETALRCEEAQELAAGSHARQPSFNLAA